MKTYLFLGATSPQEIFGKKSESKYNDHEATSPQEIFGKKSENTYNDREKILQKPVFQSRLCTSRYSCIKLRHIQHKWCEKPVYIKQTHKLVIPSYGNGTCLEVILPIIYDLISSITIIAWYIYTTYCVRYKQGFKKKK